MASRGTNVSVACKPSEFNADPELAYKISRESQLLLFGVNDVFFDRGHSSSHLVTESRFGSFQRISANTLKGSIP